MTAGENRTGSFGGHRPPLQCTARFPFRVVLRKLAPMAHASEATLSATPLTDFRPETFRGATGFFRAAQDAGGRWSLLDPDDRPFFCRAVHGVRASAPATNEGGAAPFAAVDAATRLRAWGFNAVGAGGDGAGRDDGLAYFASVDFCRAVALIQAPGARLPDVFDSDWPRRATTHALEVCAPLARERGLIGWLADDRPGWAQPEATAVLRAGAAPEARPTLLQICLSLEPAFAAYHAAWEFVLALHGGKLESVARAWGAPLANKEVVRERTRAEQGFASRGYLRDHSRWTREFARRYFTSTAAAIRAADQHHLVLGCRFGGPVGEPVRVECAAPAVDVALLDWRELPAVHPAGSAGAGPADASAVGIGRPGLGGPVLAGDFCWADEKFFGGQTAGSRAHGFTAVERMLRRGRAAFARTARHPAVVGYVWPQWLDEPGEQPPFARGLVHGNGAEAREHTELLADLNARAESLRRAGAVLPVSP